MIIKHLPKILYHATFRHHKKSILKYGLDPSRIKKKTWDDCFSWFIYLSTNKEHALSYCEASDDVPEDWLDEIIVYEILTSDLDLSLLNFDPNDSNAYQKGQEEMLSGVVLAYKGNISVNLLNEI
jgi:hypothetical protein